MARKKKALPFVVQPRRQPIVEQIGTEDSGVIAIERRGYLNVAEKSLVQYAMEDDNSLADMYALSGRIAREVELPLQQVLEEITQQPLPAHRTEDKLLPDSWDVRCRNECRHKNSNEWLARSRKTVS